MAKIYWKGVIVHITDTRLDYDRKMCDTGHRSRSWDQCGYHFLILRNGLIERSRNLETQGAHAKGYNNSHIGVAIVGKNDSTPKQIESFKLLYKNLIKEYGELELIPHNAVNPNKTCPTERVWKEIING